MPRPRKSDAAKQPMPTPVAPAPAPVPMGMPAPSPQQMMHPQSMPPPQMAPAPMGQAPPYGVPLAPVAPRTLDVEQFVRVRDSVHTRFTTILGLMKSFSDDFLRQTNLLLGEPTPFDNGGPSMQALVANLDGMAGQLGELGAGGEEKKERKKRSHDPNAPKRPLTPYFLYMQTARAIIATDLGPDAPKGAVQEEGQRRWAAMLAEEKQAWHNAYQFNLRLYSARVHSYKNGNPEAKNMTDADAMAYADSNGIPQAALAGGEEAVAPANDQDAIAEQLTMAPPVAALAAADDAKGTPKGKGSRKRKSTAAEAEESEAAAAKTATPASPEKKRKRQSKAAAPEAEEPKKSGRKKKN